MNVLITGGAGYIGSHTVTEVLNGGYFPVVLDNLSTGFRDSIPADVPFIQGNICDLQILNAVLAEYSIDTVIHFAAKSVVPESFSRALEYYETNVVGSLQLLKACQNKGVKKLVFSSTAAVYGEASDVPVTETAALKPINPYGVSKMMAEKAIQDVAKDSNLRFVILRYFNVVGASLDGRNGQRAAGAGHLMKAACEVALGKRKALQIFGTDFSTADGTGVRDYIHVVDLARTHVSALAYLDGGGKSEILNCGYGHGASVREVVKMFERVHGQKIETQEVPRRVGDPAQLVADNQKLRLLLNWKPSYDNLEVIVRSAYEWEKSQF